MSFRLFGNIFGSGIILRIYMMLLENSVVFQIFGIITGLNLIMTLFFILFEGFLQAFVFTMLALTYLGIAIAQEHSKNTGRSHG
jgi:F-type H+-transporting ATPase subunit a